MIYKRNAPEKKNIPGVDQVKKNATFES